MNIYVPGKGIRNPEIAIVAEAPSYEEEVELQPLVGPSGRFLNAMLRESGIDRERCWVTNVCKYMVPPNPKTGRKIPFAVRARNVGIDLNKQIDELRIELHEIKPNMILALGGTALWALTGKDSIQSYRGSILQGMGFKVIGTYHPAHVLHQSGESSGYWNKYVILADMARAAEECKFSDIRLPYRNLNVCKSSAQFYDFLKRHEGFKFPAVDIEAHQCIPICVGIAFTPYEGITIPLWNTNGISNISNGELVTLWNMLSRFLAQHSCVGQNFGYDRDKLQRLGYRIGSLHSDTMLKAFCIDPELPKNLAFSTSIYTKEPYYKDEGMYEGSIEDLLIGCARDSCVTKEVDLAMDSEMDELGTRKYYENFVLKLHDLYREIEGHGFRTDMEVRKQLVEKYITLDEKLRYQLYQLAGKQVNVNSYKQVGALLYDQWKIPERTGTGEDVLYSLLNGNVVKDPAHRMGIELILEDRRVRKTISTYLYGLEDFDGRMRTTYFICLETGRSSTGQQSPPIRPNIEYRDEEKKKKKQDRGMAFQTITKHGDIGGDIRTMFIPDEGEIFLQADSSQAEARVVFKLADDEEALRDIDTHDYHALTATWFFGGKEEDYSKKVLGYEHPIRFGGKTLRHACHLAAGARTAARTVNTEARKNKIEFSISERKAEDAIRTFHLRQPKIRGIYHAAVKLCLAKDRKLRAPVPYGIDATIGGVRKFYEREGDELLREAYAYLPQRTVSENTKRAALAISGRAKWIRILAESHDALLVSVPISRKQEAALILKEEFERPIDFSNCSIPRSNLVIPCDIEEGYNYKDLDKFKWMTEAA